MCCRTCPDMHKTRRVALEANVLSALSGQRLIATDLSLTYLRTASVVRLQVLLLIAVLALMVLWLLGMVTILLNKHYQFQANSVRHKKVLSIIFIGRQMVYDKSILLTSDDIQAAWEYLKLAQSYPCQA